MQAICVDENRKLILGETPAPSAPPSGYVTVAIEAAAITGVITEVGADVPAGYLGRKVAIYRSLPLDLPFLGLWCETAQVPVSACLPLPDHIDTRDYSGSLVNVVTAYAFLEQAAADGYRAIVVTAGRSATGRALAALARRRGMPALFVVRSASSKAEMLRSGLPDVLASDDPDFLREFEHLAGKLGATAVFDGVGGTLISLLIGALPRRSSIFFYGFLSGAEDVSFNSSIFMMKDITMRMFSNFNSPTVRDTRSLAHMPADLEGCIDDPLLKTQLGQEFGLSDFKSAMSYDGLSGRKAVFVPSR
jgi:NADPH2:quinone reductase